MLIESRPATDPELAALLMAQQRELAEADGGQDGQVYLTHDDVEYLVVVVDQRVVACGAWQALEQEALAAERPVLRLETGTYLPAAVALYRSAGYVPIPVYGEYVGNPYSLCFEKSLAVISR